ncbi:aminopeptidase N [Temperatibacter marinus]|uniref:Aminopeptidase N n=1 Tax=Temperatibacter marinus TaxID=1456591 RepID=A0AA52EDI8_9PROT|nr:aminopeptidase N [Temperatibacter marinus]WND01693.1 aminopeptidase N [Temperatibacter marinus]
MKFDVIDTQPKEILLADYAAYPFAIDTIALTFKLSPAETIVTSKLSCRRLGQASTVLELNGGPYMSLLSLHMDGVLLEAEKDYDLSEEHLRVYNAPKSFELTVVTSINPQENTRLEGLYLSSGNFCTQCEAEGFRHITYYPDRPDVLSVFSVRIEALMEDYPVLLSNGNPAGAGEIAGGYHYAIWNDPHPKPAYLFALVAGNLACLTDKFHTSLGRDVTLNIYTLEKDQAKCDYAMGALKRSMQWDEETYGLAYDLDVYNIVAVSDFNMGAMENKGLNVFNTKYVLASPDTETDTDFAHVEGVIGHEYFHNWTGNRVTCRDWFQLSLKEGLTVYRDQEFSSDMGSRVIKRIDDVKALRAAQFPEDAGPFAHPVRPEKYIEINNFYTATVYNKGAEVIRMMATIIGQAAFRKGMDLYFERHDGSAVTCEDFVQAMEDASGFDLRQFRLWYSQAGTPEIKVDVKKGQGSKTILSVSQTVPSTPGQDMKKPMVIPIVMGFATEHGDCLSAQGLSSNIRPLGNGSFLLMMTQGADEFTFEGVEPTAVPSLLRGFSAPVEMETTLSELQQYFILNFDTDSFNRVEMSDLLLKKEVYKIAEQIEASQTKTVSNKLIKSLGQCLEAYERDPALISSILSMPSENDCISSMKRLSIDAVFEARQFLGKKIAHRLRKSLQSVYLSSRSAAKSLSLKGDKQAVHFRRLQNVCLSYMAKTGGHAENRLIVDQFQDSTTMTNKLAALQALVHSSIGKRKQLIRHFYKAYRKDELVVDKWFAAQALSTHENVHSEIALLQNHRDFSYTNPNRIRSLIGMFTMGNLSAFHRRCGKGYEILANAILKLDDINPQVAARMLTPLGRYHKLDKERQVLIGKQLKRILAKEGLSKPVYEMASKAYEGLKK